MVSGDADALRILLANLVSNALRYTPCGGRVDVVTGSADAVPFVEVCDSGEGIPPAERARVFDRFYRRARAGEAGSGLGLAIVRSIAERHRAQVLLDGCAWVACRRASSSRRQRPLKSDLSRPLLSFACGKPRASGH
jgi:signal transduction histidine kinase